MKKRWADTRVTLHVSKVQKRIGNAMFDLFSCHGTFNGFDYDEQHEDKTVAIEFMRQKAKHKCGAGVEISIKDHTVNP